MKKDNLKTDYGKATINTLKNMKHSSSKVFSELAANQKKQKSKKDYGKATVEALKRATSGSDNK